MTVLFSIVWLACVIAAFLLAQHKGRNRLSWTVAAALVPLSLVVLALLPRRIKLDEHGYHPDYKRLA